MKADGSPEESSSDATRPALRGESVHGSVLADQAMALENDSQSREMPFARRTYLRQVIHDSLGPTGARLGMLWVGVLFFFACFAPFVASSHPFAIKVDGHWSYPMFRHLYAVDIVLPVVFIAAAVLLLMRRLSMGAGLAMVFWVAAVVLMFSARSDVLEHFKAFKAAWKSPVSESLRMLGMLVVVGWAVFAPLFIAPRRAYGVAGVLLLPLLIMLCIFPVRPPENIVYEQYRDWGRAGRLQAVVNTIIPYSPTDRLRDLPEARLEPPGRSHWAGTDDYGADLLSRMIHGSRIALAIGFIATGIAVALGILIGGLTGYFSGVVDLVGMRIIEILEAIPTLVLLIAITASYGRNLYQMMAVIGLLRWTGDARFVRAEFLRLRKQDFVQAAIASGLPLRSILFRHMLPNGISPVLVSASFGVASAILMESTLSFLGLGLVDEPSWGAMLDQARRGGAGFNWWIATFPGLLIFLTVFSYNLVGEAARDALDPKLLKRES